MAELMQIMTRIFTRFIQVLGVWGLVWGLLWSGMALASENLSPLSFVPRQSAWMVSLTQPLNRITPQMRPVVSDFLRQQWQQLGLGRAGEDLLSLEAGLTLANTSPITAPVDHPVWIMPINQAEATEKTIAQFWKSLELTPTAETAPGIKLITPGPAVNPFRNPPQIAFGLVGDDYLLVSNSVQALRESVQAAQSVNGSILGASFYREANLDLNADTWGLSYLNLGAWQDDTEVMSPDRLLLAWQTVKKPIPGLGIQTALVRTRSGTGETLDNQPQATGLNRQLAKTLPEAAAVILGENLPELWQSFNDLLKGYGQGQAFLAQTIQAWNQQVGINLAQEMGPWLQGDFGLAWLPHRSKSDHPPLWHWQLKTPTTPTVTTGLVTLADKLTAQGWHNSPLDLENPTRQAWSPTPETPPVFITQQETTWTILATDQSELTPAPEATPAWQSLISRNTPETVIHLDWANTAPAWVETFPVIKLLQFAAPSAFEHLDGITWLGGKSQGRIQSGELILAWEK